MNAIIPAILPSSQRELEDSLARLAPVPGAEVIQIDVVDGRFATPASWPYEPRGEGRGVGGEEILLPYLGQFRFEIDLMVEEPEQSVGQWLDAGAARLTLHLESMKDPSATLAAVKRRYGHDSDATARTFELGLAIGMSTDLALLEPHIPHIDYVQLMGIDTIGRQGEPFDAVVTERVRVLRARHPALVIQIDGGVSLTTAPQLFAAGADRVVVGHALLASPNIAKTFAAFDALAPHHASYTDPMTLTDMDIKALEEKANEIRQTIIEMLVATGSGHTAGPLGMADIFTAFYFHILKHNPRDPEWEGRDRLILSNGHICPVRYATMAHAGYFPIEECLTLRTFGSRLQGHPERLRLPGLETTSGPLGSGLSQAAGMAYVYKNLKSQNTSTKPRVYCVMSDGEQEEGNTWEAAMFAGKHTLHNLTAIMDRNNIQIDGMTEEVMPLEPLADKYRAFNWHVLEVGGHDIRAFVAAVEEAQAIYEKPTLIIAHTIPGKGIKEIEFDYRWHGKPPTKEEGARFLKEIRSMGGRVPHEYA